MIEKITSKKPVKKRNAEATKSRLLEVGEDLFSDHGFDRTTLEMIANAANVNKAMIRYYYKDKAGLYSAIVESVVSDTLAHLEHALPDTEDPVTGMADFVEIFASTIISRPSFPRMLIRDYLDGDIMNQPEPSQTLRRFMQTTQSFYQRGREKNLFQEFDPHMLHLSIVSSAIFFSITQSFRQEMARQTGQKNLNIDITAFTSHLRRLIMSGISTNEFID